MLLNEEVSFLLPYGLGRYDDETIGIDAAFAIPTFGRLFDN